MARNEEKALTLFNKWQTFKKDFHSSAGNKRPLLASDCDSLADAEKHRRDILRDVTKKIAAIHNATLGEHRIREMNDDINKLLRQKHFWETRVVELGGDVRKGRQFYDVEGKELPGARGYKYYGAAQDLPGVRELFAENDEEKAKKRLKRSRADLQRFITPDYYGYRDEDDGILLEKEAAREKELVAEAVRGYEEKKAELLKRMQAGTSSADSSGLTAEEISMLEESDDEEELRRISKITVRAAVLSNADAGLVGEEQLRDRESEVTRVSGVVPSQAEMTALLIEQRKKALMEKLGAM